MDYFAKPPVPRHQIVLFETMLDECIADNHPVRLFDEVLGSWDFRSWEARYSQNRGRPPIPPRVVAAVVLYGLTRGIRSSRRLEYECSNGLDMKWLAEGRVIDHSTICIFRTDFKQELRELFQETCKLAMAMGLVQLNEVGLDGTRVKANSSRSSTATAKTLEERLAALDAELVRMLDEAEEADRRDAKLFDVGDSPRSLPRKLATFKRRQAALTKALAAAKKGDAKRSAKGGQGEKEAAAAGETPAKDEGGEKGKDGEEDTVGADGEQAAVTPDASEEESKSQEPVKVPTADPESVILPNKEGGYAPNYNPIATVDEAGGFIVDQDVLADASEAEAVVPTLERLEANFGKLPDRLLADKGFATGENLSEVASRGVEGFMPMAAREDVRNNPAVRPDPREPVPESAWAKLPRQQRAEKKLDRSAFIYDETGDCYFCPMGRKLVFVRTKAKSRATSSDSIYRCYRCETCEGCRLADACLSGRSRCRTVSYDQHEIHRQAMTKRLRTERGREIYARRAWLAETPNAVIKACMGIRQFLLRGLDKVKTEWLWACTAYNLAKLVRVIASLRVRFVEQVG